MGSSAEWHPAAACWIHRGVGHDHTSPAIPATEERGRGLVWAPSLGQDFSDLGWRAPQRPG